MAKKIVISELDFDTDGAVQAQANLLSQITKVKEAQKELRKETQNLSDANDKQRKSYVENEQQLKKLNSEYKLNQKVIDESTTAIDGLNDAMDKEIKTKRDAIKNNKELREIQNNVNATTEEGRKLIEKLSKKIDENTDFIKENSDSFVKQKMNIGNYTDSVVSAANQVNILGVGMGDLGTGLMGVGKGAGSGSKGLQIMRTAATALVAVPIIALFAGLATMLTKTQEGMDIVNKLTLQLQGAFGVIIERASFLGKAVVKLFSGDFKGAVETAGKAFESGFTDKIKEAVEEGGAVAELQKANRELTNQSIVTIAELEKQAEALNQTADDATLSLDKQQKAAAKAAKVEEQIAKERIKQAQRELKQFTSTAKVKGRLNAEDKKTIAELEAAVKEAEKEKTAAVMRNATRTRQIDQDTFEQRLDYLIDGFDNFKTVQERILADERTTAEDRINILNRLQEEFEINTAQQIALFEEQAGVKINLNELTQISDQETLYNEVAMLELSEIENQRLLEVIRENRTFEQDLSEQTLEVVQKNLEQELSLRSTNLETEQINAETASKARIQQAIDENESIINIMKVQAEERYNLEKDRIENEYNLKIDEAENTILNEEDKKAELSKINAEYQSNLTQLEIDNSAERRAIQQAQFDFFVGAATSALDAVIDINTAQLDKELGQIDDRKNAIEEKYNAEIAKAGDNAEEVERLEKEKDEALAALSEEALTRQEEYDKKVEQLNKARAVIDVVQGITKGFQQGGLAGAVASAAIGVALLKAQGNPVGDLFGFLAIPKFAANILKKIFDTEGGQSEGNSSGQSSGITGGGGSNDNNGNSDERSFDFNFGGGNFRGTPFLEGKGNATSDDILFLGSRGEAVIPTQRNLQYLGLSKAMIDGNVGEWVLSNTHLIGNNFNDANIVSGLNKVKNAVRSNRPQVRIEEVSLRDKMNRETYLQNKYGGIR